MEINRPLVLAWPYCSSRHLYICSTNSAMRTPRLAIPTNNAATEAKAFLRFFAVAWGPDVDVAVAAAAAALTSLLTSLLTSMSRPCFYVELCQKIELDMVLGSLGVTHFSGLLVLATSDAVNTGPRIVCGMALAVPGGVRGTDRRSVGAAFGRRDRPDWECEQLRRTLGRKLGG